MRRLSDTERKALPQALVHVLPVDHIRLIDAPHILCRLARLINKGPLIVARGRHIFWPNLPEDLSKRPEQLALLAHELTHVWQYETGMTLWSYLWRERGQYRYSLIADKPFPAYGYEQQAAMVEDMVRLNSGLPTRWAETSVTLSQLSLVIRFS